MGDIDLLTLLGNYAFPIVCCIGLFWKMDKDEKSRQAEREAERKERAAEADKFATAVNNNTLTVQRLIDWLKGGDATHGSH